MPIPIPKPTPKPRTHPKLRVEGMTIFYLLRFFFFPNSFSKKVRDVTDPSSHVMLGSATGLTHKK